MKKILLSLMIIFFLVGCGMTDKQEVEYYKEMQKKGYVYKILCDSLVGSFYSYCTTYKFDTEKQMIYLYDGNGKLIRELEVKRYRVDITDLNFLIDSYEAEKKARRKK